MKATKLLESQHREVEGIFEAIKSGKGDLSKLVVKLADALVGHMVIEQEYFYPAVKTIDEDLVLESFEEHATAEIALRRLLATDPFDTTFKAKVTVLEELIKHHVKEEEKEFFPKVERAMGDDLEALGTTMKTAFDEAMEVGHEGTLSGIAPHTAVDDDLSLLISQSQPRPSSPSHA